MNFVSHDGIMERLGKSIFINFIILKHIIFIACLLIFCYITDFAVSFGFDW